MKTTRTIFFLLAYLALTGCGHIGPLYLPDKGEPETVAPENN